MSHRREKPTRYDNTTETLLIELWVDNPIEIELDDYDDAQYEKFIAGLEAWINSVDGEEVEPEC